MISNFIPGFPNFGLELHVSLVTDNELIDNILSLIYRNAGEKSWYIKGDQLLIVL